MIGKVRIVNEIRAAERAEANKRREADSRVGTRNQRVVIAAAGYVAITEMLLFENPNPRPGF